ncbi:hypothetical protein EZY14_002745 [Kordia sp. TARA_039_SRF]|nr:hypothetical protein EZY14_002745 [Kordia sp. TARA_039_SRF]
MTKNNEKKQTKKQIVKAVKELHNTADVSLLLKDLHIMYDHCVLSALSTNPRKNHELKFTYENLASFLNVIESLLTDRQETE